MSSEIDKKGAMPSDEVFREWLDEQKAHAAIVEKDSGLDSSLKSTIRDRCIEPFGTWKLGRWKSGATNTVQHRQETAAAPNGNEKDKGQTQVVTAKDNSQRPDVPTLEQKKKTEEVIAGLNSAEKARQWRLKYPDMPVVKILSEKEIGLGQYLKTETGQHFPEVAKALGDIGWVWNKDQSVFVWKGVKA